MWCVKKNQGTVIVKKINGLSNTQFQVIRMFSKGLDFIHWELMGLKTVRLKNMARPITGTLFQRGNMLLHFDKRLRRQTFI